MAQTTTVKLKDEVLNDLLYRLALRIDCKELSLEASQNMYKKLKETFNTEKEKNEEAYKLLYKTHKQIKSLSILLSKDSLKKMNEEELRDVIDTAKSMVFSTKNILSRYLQENGLQD